MGRWPGTICKPSESPSTRLTTAALSGSWAVGCARMSSSWSATSWRPRRPRGWPGPRSWPARGATPCGNGAGLATKSWRPSWTPRWGGVRPRRAGPLPVDLEELSELLEASLGEEGGRIDLETGEVWRASTIEYFAEQEPEQAPDFEDPDRWLYVGPEGSDEGYRDMEDFIARVDDAG